VVRILGFPAFGNERGNPYNATLYRELQRRGAVVHDFTPARAARGGYDVWHLHWPDAMVGSERSRASAAAKAAALLALVTTARRRGTRIVWTAHNARSHDGRHPAVEARLMRALTARLDGVIALSRAAAELVRMRHPGLRETPLEVIPHGHYRGLYPPPLPRHVARAALGLRADVPVMTFFGRVAPYKGVVPLIRAFRALERLEATLLVAGRPTDREHAERVRAAAAGAPGINLDLSFVPSERVPLVLGAADVVVLPYSEVLSSGSALLALSYDRPVLLPDTPAVRELAGTVGEGWVRPYDGQLTPGVLREALAWGRAAADDTHVPLGGFDWPPIADATLAFFERLVRPRP
jgi:glycosyltransferase involved in cell wall biosynthesis